MSSSITLFFFLSRSFYQDAFNKEFFTLRNEYDNLLAEIEHKTVNLREKLGELVKIADEFYFTKR